MIMERAQAMGGLAVGGAGFLAQAVTSLAQQDVPELVGTAVTWGSPLALVYGLVHLMSFIHRSASESAAEQSREANERADEWAQRLAEQAQARAEQALAERDKIQAEFVAAREQWAQDRFILQTQIDELKSAVNNNDERRT